LVTEPETPPRNDWPKANIPNIIKKVAVPAVSRDIKDLFPHKFCGSARLTGPIKRLGYKRDNRV